MPNHVHLLVECTIRMGSRLLILNFGVLATGERGSGFLLECHNAVAPRIMAEDSPVIVKILRHLGLPTRAPPRARVRRVDLFQTI